MKLYLICIDTSFMVPGSIFHVNFVNPFHTRSLFLYTLKTLENQWFSDVLRGYIYRDQWHEMG